MPGFTGQVDEWFKSHAWKACLGYYPNAGSNPALSATEHSETRTATGFAGFLLPGECSPTKPKIPPHARTCLLALVKGRTSLPSPGL